MRFENFSFGSIRIDGVTYEHDVVIDRGEIRKRKKNASKQYQDAFGHTALSIEEDLPWKCRRLVVGTGAYGRLPVMKEVKCEAERREVELLVFPTTEAIKAHRRARCRMVPFSRSKGNSCRKTQMKDDLIPAIHAAVGRKTVCLSCYFDLGGPSVKSATRRAEALLRLHLSFGDEGTFVEVKRGRYL